MNDDVLAIEPNEHSVVKLTDPSFPVRMKNNSFKSAGFVPSFKERLKPPAWKYMFTLCEAARS